jgi:inorganic pyrophosphatase
LYGFIPQTLCGESTGELSAQRTGLSDMKGDGDPMDICVLSEKTFAQGNFFLRARPIGGLGMIDGNEADDKIVAILEFDVAYGHLEDISQCPPGIIDRLKHYFLSYKQLPGDAPRRVEIGDVYGKSEALNVIDRSLKDYRDCYGDPALRLAAALKNLE